MLRESSKAALGDESLRNAVEFYSEGDRKIGRGDYRAAEEAYQKAIEAAPDFPWGHNNLAWQLATASDPDYRNGEAALIHAQRASEITGNRYHGILDTLAAAYAELGNFAKAAEIEEQAVRVAPEYARGEYEFVLNRYRAGLPWCPYNNDFQSDE